MLLLLTQWLSNEYRLFSVFNYLTLRAALATLTALFIGLLCGPRVIRKLTAMKIGPGGAAGRPADLIWSSRARPPWVACWC